MNCATGCVTRCLLQDCPGPGCQVCEPRLATIGQLCARCWSCLQRDVLTAPALVEHLFEEAAQGSRGLTTRTGGRPSSRGSGGASLYPAALAAADELHMLLVSWAMEVDRLRPGAWRALPVTGTWATPGAGEDRRPVGIRDPRACRGMVEWLRPHLEWVASQYWAGDMRSEIARATATAAARWPMDEPTRRIDYVACPQCGYASLVEIPPVRPGSPRVVICEMPTCAVTLHEDEWARLRADALALASGEVA